MADERRHLIPRGTYPEESPRDPHAHRHSPWSMRISCGAILVTVVLERLAFYALVGNLVLFLNTDPFEWESYHAMNASFYFLGLSFITSLFGGWLADSILGRYKTVLVAFFVYIGGYVFMPLLTHKKSVFPHVCQGPNATKLFNITDTFTDLISDDKNPFDENCSWLIYIVLTIVAIGTGSFKTTIVPFGADQVTGEGQQATLGFFNWYYWCVNIGAFFGLAAMTWVEQDRGFFLGYLAACICLACGAVVFVLGTCSYIRKPPAGSVLTNIFRIIREACRQKHRRKRDSRSKLFTSGRMVDTAEPTQQKLSFLDYAKSRHGGVFHDTLVEDVKELRKVVCVFAVLVPYWIVYFQMQTTFLVQGLHMNLMSNRSSESSINGTTKFQIVPAWFSLFDVTFLIILLPLFDRVIYPRLQRAGYPFGMTKRIAVGMVFAMVAMVMAGVVEHYRLQAFWPNASEPCVSDSISQNIGSSTFYAANMTILWQIPQYALIGISEVFTSVAGLQFAYAMAPDSMKSIIMGLFYLFSGIGSLLGTAVISTLSSAGLWFHNIDYGDINCRKCNLNNSTTTTYTQACHLDYYFYLLAVVEFVGLILFIVVARMLNLGDEMPNNSSSRKRLTTIVDKDDDELQHSIQRSVSAISS